MTATTVPIRFANPPVWLTPGVGSDWSMVEIPGGRALAVWIGSGGVRQAVAGSAVVPSFGADTLAVPLSGTSGARVSISRIDGVNWLVVASSNFDGIYRGTRLFRDTSTGQDGSSWVQWADIQVVSGNLGSFFRGAKAASKILVLPSGRWVVAATEVGTASGSTRAAWNSIYTSDNNGATWTRRLRASFYIVGGIYGRQSGRNIVRHNGELWWGATGDPGGTRYYRSTDDGTTWTIAATFGIRYSNFVATDPTGLWVMENTTNTLSTGQYSVRRNPGNPAIDPWDTIVAQSFAWGGTSQSDIVGGRWRLWTADRLMQAGSVGGWVVGAVGRG